MTDPDEPRVARSIRTVTRVTIGAVLSIGDQAAAIMAPDDDHPDDHDDDAPTRLALPSGEPELEPRWRHLVIGTAFAAEDRAVELSRLAGRVTGRVTPLAGWILDAPMISPVRRRVEGTIDGLIDRGRAEEDLGRAQAGQLFNGAIETAVASPKVDDVVGGVVGRVLDPVLDEALPKVLDNLQHHPELLAPVVNAIVDEVLGSILATAMPQVLDSLSANPEQIVPLVNSIVAEALDPIMQQALPKVLGDIEQQPEMMVPLVESLIGEVLEPVLTQALPQVIDVLNEDPDAIRSLVRDQSTGIAADMTHQVRSQAANADDRLDRAVRKVLRRKPPAELPAGEQTALPPGDAPPGDAP